MRGTYSEVRIKAFFRDIKIIEIEPQYILLMTPGTDTLDYVREQQAVPIPITEQTGRNTAGLTWVCPPVTSISMEAAVSATDSMSF